MDFGSVLTTAATLLGDKDPRAYRQMLSDHLTETGAYRPVPTRADGYAMPVCVDGAVASEQTDALTWIAAVGVSSADDADVPAAMVMPVGSHSDRTRSMLMALCELASALQTVDRHGEVWMDGSLATPLISIATALLVTDPTAMSLICEALTEYNADGLIGDYIHYASLGKIRALPKQDTASGFCELWARQVEHPALTEWLLTQRDRMIATDILAAGHYLAPRRATEAGRVEAKAPASASAEARAWAGTFDELLAHWRNDVAAYVTYALPVRATSRAVKVEFTVAADADEAAILELAGEVSARAGQSMLGARIREPLPQHMADGRAKRQVTSLVTSLTSAAQVRFRHTHPAAVRRYRT